MRRLVALDDFISCISRFYLGRSTVREVVEVAPSLSFHSAQRTCVEGGFGLKVSYLGVNAWRIIAVEKPFNLSIRRTQVIPSPSDIRLKLGSKQCER